MAGKRGTLSIYMDGRWDIEDLLKLSDALKDTYAYFYAVGSAGGQQNIYLERMLTDHFWQGRGARWKLEEQLYGSIPREDALKIISIRYSSPGLMEIAGGLGALILMAKAANAWLDVGSKLVDTYTKIEKFFHERKHLQKPKLKFSLDSTLARDIDLARELMFELGDDMGYSNEDCEKILDLLSNPVAGLKFMVALAGETRKISALSEKGLLKLPRPPKEQTPTVEKKEKKENPPA